MPKTLIHDIGELVTMAPLADEGRATGITMADLGRLTNAWLLIDGATVHSLGTGAPPVDADTKIDARGGLVLPGLVDSHTHPLFGGNRALEFCRRLEGATYQEIAAAGGGIQATVRGSRAASDEELSLALARRLERMAAHGVTTAEVKSGYGLSVDEEYRHLFILRTAKDHAPITLSITCLALHAASPEHASLKAYVDTVTRSLLPRVAEEGLADWVDAFIEQGYFSVQDVEPYVEKALDLGLGIRLHADEFSNAGAAAAAAAWGAASADHLQCASEAGIKALGAAQVTATLLPGTSLYTGIPYTNGRRLADAGCPVAVASDFNPGSSNIDNLPMLAALACLQGKLTPAEAVAGVTWVPARSLGLADKKGALTPGRDADLVLYLPDTGTPRTVEEWLYDFGGTLPDKVFSRGKQVSGR